MQCEQAVKLVELYLDSELDSRTSFEISRHLEACAGCRTRFEAERTLESEIAGEFGRVDPAWAEAWARAGRRRRSRRRIAAAAAAGLIAVCCAATALLLLWPGEADPPSDEPELARLSLSSHRKFLQGALPSEHASTRASELGLMLSKTDIPLPPLQDLPVDVWLPSGARGCKLGSVPVAYLTGHMNGLPVSVFVMPRERLPEFPITLGRLEAPKNAFHCVIEGIPFAAAIRGDSCVCAVGAVEAGRLESLAQGLVRNE